MNNNVDSHNETSVQQASQPDQKAESQTKKPSMNKLLIDMVFSIFIPVLVLRKFSGEDSLGPTYALVVALAFPLAIGIYEFIKDKKVGLVPSIGFISTLLTGGIGVLQLPKEYIAIKEALVPLGFGVAVLLSTFTKSPLVKTFIYNDMVMETEKVADKVSEIGKETEFNGIMKTATWILAASFLLSSVLNYALAKILIVSETGTEAFNQELSNMTLWSYPVIVVPSMVVTLYAMYFVINRILKMTGFTLEEIMRT